MITLNSQLKTSNVEMGHQSFQVQVEQKPVHKEKTLQMQGDSVDLPSSNNGVMSTLKATGAGSLTGMIVGSMVSVIPMLASTDNMRGLYVMSGAAAGIVGGALAGGMHGHSPDAKASAASAAIIGGVLGGVVGLASGGVKGALVGSAMAASIGASGAFAGSIANR